MCFHNISICNVVSGLIIYIYFINKNTEIMVDTVLNGPSDLEAFIGYSRLHLGCDCTKESHFGCDCTRTYLCLKRASLFGLKTDELV